MNKRDDVAASKGDGTELLERALDLSRRPLWPEGQRFERELFERERPFFAKGEQHLPLKQPHANAFVVKPATSTCQVPGGGRWGFKASGGRRGVG